MTTEHESGYPTQPAPVRTTAPAPKSADRSRRAFLFKLSLLLNGAVGAVLAVPILGYLLGPAFKRDKDYKSWISLGPIDDFPEGETRLVDYRNPVTTAADGETGNVACWVRRIQGRSFRSSPSTARTSAARCAGSRNRSLFMCPCHGGAYYEDGSRASGPPERGLFEYQLHHRRRQAHD